jgi:hypothetical protein
MIGDANQHYKFIAKLVYGDMGVIYKAEEFIQTKKMFLIK